MSLQRLLLLVLLGLCAWPVYAESEASTPARAWPQAAAPIPYKQDQEEGLMGRAIGGFALALLLAWGGRTCLEALCPLVNGAKCDCHAAVAPCRDTTADHQVHIVHCGAGRGVPAAGRGLAWCSADQNLTETH